MMFCTTLTSAAVPPLRWRSTLRTRHAPPALGVTGSPVRNDVSACPPPSLATTPTLPRISTRLLPFLSRRMGARDELNVTNFNRAGSDGSRSVSVLVDPTGTGKNFVAAKATKNGDPAPKTNGSGKVALSLPAGTKCTGGKTGNLCLLQPASAPAPSFRSSLPAPPTPRRVRPQGTHAVSALRIGSESRNVHGNPVFAATLL
ncbi:hypothetical protein B0H14DRAFT_2751746 [Mycena olivaceomarginata]|nr:hypothetical protein B0H14DRAFT_2751746 [Mycena olivaceomarginata]